jgi:Phage integrase family
LRRRTTRNRRQAEQHRRGQPRRGRCARRVALRRGSRLVRHITFHALTRSTTPGEVVGVSPEGSSRQFSGIHGPRLRHFLNADDDRQAATPIARRSPTFTPTRPVAPASPLRQERARVAGVDLAPAAYVWSQDLDAATPYRPDRVTGAFRSLRDRLGLPHVTFHALRHFAATTLAGQGVAVRTIAGRLGHANPVTLRTYAHFLDAADREAATAIGKALADLRPTSTSRPTRSAKPRQQKSKGRLTQTESNSPEST